MTINRDAVLRNVIMNCYKHGKIELEFPDVASAHSLRMKLYRFAKAYKDHPERDLELAEAYVNTSYNVEEGPEGQGFLRGRAAYNDPLLQSVAEQLKQLEGPQTEETNLDLPPLPRLD